MRRILKVLLVLVVLAPVSLLLVTAFTGVHPKTMYAKLLLIYVDLVGAEPVDASIHPGTISEWHCWVVEARPGYMEAVCRAEEKAIDRLVMSNGMVFDDSMLGWLGYAMGKSLWMVNVTKIYRFNFAKGVYSVVERIETHLGVIEKRDTMPLKAVLYTLYPRPKLSMDIYDEEKGAFRILLALFNTTKRGDGEYRLVPIPGEVAANLPISPLAKAWCRAITTITGIPCTVEIVDPGDYCAWPTEWGNILRLAQSIRCERATVETVGVVLTDMLIEEYELLGLALRKSRVVLVTTGGFDLAHEIGHLLGLEDLYCAEYCPYYNDMSPVDKQLIGYSLMNKYGPILAVPRDIASLLTALYLRLDVDGEDAVAEAIARAAREYGIYPEYNALLLPVVAVEGLGGWNYTLAEPFDKLYKMNTVYNLTKWEESAVRRYLLSIGELEYWGCDLAEFMRALRVAAEDYAVTKSGLEKWLKTLEEG